jgi:hypothetical protein
LDKLKHVPRQPGRASDDEDGLPQKDIKQAVKNWRADTYRV